MTNQIAEYSATESALAELKTNLSGVIFDCTVPAEMKSAKEARQLCVKTRTGLEGVRKDIKAPALSHCQAIDSEARRITAQIYDLETPIDQQIKKEEKPRLQKRLKKIVNCCRKNRTG